jgi:ankyrin repeat protein
MNIEEMNREVLECARYGEADDLRELLKNGADVNFKDDSGNTALHRAAANGELECLGRRNMLT